MGRGATCCRGWAAVACGPRGVRGPGQRGRVQGVRQAAAPGAQHVGALSCELFHVCTPMHAQGGRQAAAQGVQQRGHQEERAPRLLLPQRHGAHAREDEGAAPGGPWTRVCAKAKAPRTGRRGCALGTLCASCAPRVPPLPPARLPATPYPLVPHRPTPFTPALAPPYPAPPAPTLAYPPPPACPARPPAGPHGPALPAGPSAHRAGLQVRDRGR